MSNLEGSGAVQHMCSMGRNECGLDDAGDNGPGGEGKGKKERVWKGQERADHLLR